MAADKLLVLVTGANTGIGYWIVQQLSTSGKYHVFLGSRSLSKANDAITSLESDEANTSNIEPIQIDVTSDDSIVAAAEHIHDKYGYLDILVNNAGISKAIGILADNEPNADGSGPSIREQFRQQYDTNLFGAFVTTETFLPLLRKSTRPGGKRIIFTGSSTASLQIATNPPYPGIGASNYTIYRSTKTALNMIVAAFAERLGGEEGFVVGSICPGHCGTNLNGFKGQKDPRDGAKAVIMGIEGEKERVHGILSNEEGMVPW